MTGIFGGRNILQGVGSPEGVVVARIGTIYERLDGGSGSTLYVKEANSTSAVGWVSYTGGGPAAQIPAFVQAKSYFNGGAAGTIVLAFDSPVVQGNMIAISASWGYGTIEAVTSIADGLSNTFTRITACDQADAVANQQATMFYAKNINAGACTITITLSTNRSARRMIIAEYQGLNTTEPLDQAISAAQANAGTGVDSVNPGSLTPAAANSLIVGAFQDCTGGVNALTAGTNFTLRAGNPGSPTTGLEDRVLATPGSVSARFTEQNDHRVLSAMAVFKP